MALRRGGAESHDIKVAGSMVIETNWVADEDPQVVMMRMAKETSEWRSRFRSNKDAVVDERLSYKKVLGLLTTCYEFAMKPDLDELVDAEGAAIIREKSEWIRLCCNGSDPIAGMVWMEMVAKLRESSSDAEWMIEKLSPISLDMKRAEFVFGIERTEDAKRVCETYMPMLRWAIAEVLVSRVTVEIWDNDINVWGGDGDEAA